MPRTKSFSPADALDKAIELFRLRGFNNTSMQTIAKHLGISRSSIYTTFGDMHTLFVAALRQYGPSCRLPGLRELRVSSTPRAAIIRVFELAIAAADDRFTYDRCLLVNSAIELRDPSPEIAQILQAAFLDLESSFRQAIERAQAGHAIAVGVDPPPRPLAPCSPCSSAYRFSFTPAPSMRRSPFFSTSVSCYPLAVHR